MAHDAPAPEIAFFFSFFQMNNCVMRCTPRRNFAKGRVSDLFLNIILFFFVFFVLEGYGEKGGEEVCV